MKRIYLDSAPVIYLVEKTAPYEAQVSAQIQPDDWVVVSQLTRMECRVLPIRMGDPARLRDFDDFFTEYVNEIVPLSAEVVDKATVIRATYRFSPMDSLHLAAAIVSGCEVFLTNDLRLTRFAEIVVKTL